MTRKLFLFCLLAASLGGLTFWLVTAPKVLDPAVFVKLSPGDVSKGETIFWQSGCASCHAAPGAKENKRLELVGGLALTSPFGQFYAPNISMHLSDGIGSWDFKSFANAMQRGVSPKGQHYYPAFPYNSYQNMELNDVADLFAFMQTLPAVAGVAPEHELPFPLNIRRLLGGWKLLFFKSGPIVKLDNATDIINRGQYLVEGVGHCGECHTPRNFLGGLIRDRWLSGAKNPEGQGSIPNITGGEGGLGDWSEAQISSMLKDGFKPDFDSTGGSMSSVVQNWSHTSDQDRAAVAAYLKAIPNQANGYGAGSK